MEALEQYRRLDRYGFTPPGHRQGRGTDRRVLDVLGREPFHDDVLATSGLDDRRSSNNYLADAERLMADAVGADYAFFSTCGSSLSVKAAMMAVAGNDPGGLLLSRDSHKSIVAGLIFAGITPRWITPQWDAAHHISHPPSPSQVRDAWEKNPDAAGALIVSPSPYGTCADLAAIADECHRRGKPLIVDEAWGAHLPFHEGLPTWAMDAGADVCVVSVHKMGMGFEQGSVFHVQGDLVDTAHLSACADLLMTTSPNVMIYSALDGWRRQMVETGHELLDTALTLVTSLRDDIEQLPDLEVLDSELLGHQASHDLDRMQVLIDVSRTGATGYTDGSHRLSVRGLAPSRTLDRRRHERSSTHSRDRLHRRRSRDHPKTAGRPRSSLRRSTKFPRHPPHRATLSCEPSTRNCVIATRGILRPNRNGPRRTRCGTYRRRATHPVPTRNSGRGARRAPRRGRHRLPSVRAARGYGRARCHRLLTRLLSGDGVTCSRFDRAPPGIR